MPNDAAFSGQSSQEIVYNFHDSITREVIMIDENSLNLLIRKYTAGKETLKDAVGYLMTAAAITLTFATSTFHDNFLLEASVWKAVFIICDAMLFWKAGKSFWDYQRSEIKTPEEFVKKLKADSVTSSRKTAPLTPFT